VENSLATLENFSGIVSDDAMPRKRVSMRKIHDVLRLHFGLKLPQRQIARSVRLILTSQVPVANWHEQIGDATVADGILDRLVHNAHRIEMTGESMRKNKTAKTDARAKSKTA
jgi:hypothetical protein